MVQAVDGASSPRFSTKGDNCLVLNNLNANAALSQGPRQGGW